MFMVFLNVHIQNVVTSMSSSSCYNNVVVFYFYRTNLQLKFYAGLIAISEDNEVFLEEIGNKQNVLLIVS